MLIPTPSVTANAVLPLEGGNRCGGIKKICLQSNILSYGQYTHEGKALERPLRLATTNTLPLRRRQINLKHTAALR